MKLILENTDKIITVLKDNAEFPARLWHGHSESGIYVQCLVLRIAVENTDRQEEFQRELIECNAPQDIPDVFSMRMVM